jgi:hypothetical protein
MTGFSFGSFDLICEHAALTVCPLLGTGQGIMPTCYSRNVQLGSQIVFQPGGEFPFSDDETFWLRLRSNLLCPHCSAGHDRYHVVPHPI